MIYIDIRGNAGNQFFIYSFARELQKKTGQVICLNTYYLNKYFPEYKFSLSEFRLNSKVIINSRKRLPFFMNTYCLPIKALKSLFSLFPSLGRICSKLWFLLMSKFGVYIWLGETYVTIPIKNHRNYYITGFWQSERYFSDISSVLREELICKTPLQEKNKDLFNLINHTESICVTIRRGDYINNKNIKRNYYICDDQYFYKGVSMIREHFNNAIVICFSDDIDWVKKNLNFNCPTYYESGNDSIGEKIRLMASCKHFVISNSSFSWWASYLSVREGITVAPSKWYVDNRPADIYRNNWHYIDI